MKRLGAALLGLAVFLPAGCEKGQSTAPSTQPARADKGESPRKLTVRAMSEQTVTQDRADEITVYVNRDNFDGPVDVALENLPPKVTLETKDTTIPQGQNSIKLTIKAAPDATPMDNHKVKVVAKPKDQPDMQPATLEFDLDVKAKK